MKSFVEGNFGKMKTKGLLPATELIKGIDRFDLSAFGFGVGLGRRDVPSQLGTPTLNEVLIDHLGAPLAEFPVLLELDRLDDAWDGSEESKSLLVGLLKAAKDLNDRFRAGVATGSRVVIFLRTDIYDALSFDDKDKHRPFEETTCGRRSCFLTWSIGDYRQARASTACSEPRRCAEGRPRSTTSSVGRS